MIARRGDDDPVGLVQGFDQFGGGHTARRLCRVIGWQVERLPGENACPGAEDVPLPPGQYAALVPRLEPSRSVPPRPTIRGAVTAPLPLSCDGVDCHGDGSRAVQPRLRTDCSDAHWSFPLRARPCCPRLFSEDPSGHEPTPACTKPDGMAKN